MAQPVLTAEPESFAAGDSLSWTKTLADYLPADGWSILYCFRGLNLSTLDITTTTSGGSHLATLSTSASTGLLPGVYTVSGYAQKTGSRVQVYAGKITVTQNLATAVQGEDTRSQNLRTFENICAVIEGRASSSVLRSTVNGTTLERTPIADLLNLRNYYAGLVAREDAMLRSQLGKPSRRNVYAQFTSP